MKTTSTRDHAVPLGADQSSYVRLYQAVIFRAAQDLAQKQDRAIRRQMTETEEDETEPTVLREPPPTLPLLG